ncbi:hypothetical protein RhiJN_02284 [Ceratobasidium sp. AG-Ba]|nr:hypothetical protein RhiJN_02284 [Ceratobasidium sp. AG-Ba]
MAQYDALHALVAAQGFGTQEVISPATHVAPPGNDSSLHSDESDESAGEGDSGASNLTKERGGAERSNDEDEDDSSGSEPETGDENYYNYELSASGHPTPLNSLN